MRSKSIVLAVVACLVFSGCTSIPFLHSHPKVNLDGQLRAYGMVNKWINYSDYDKYMSILEKNGCNATWVEIFGNDEDGWINNTAETKKRFTKFLDAAKDHGIIVFVNIVNWNGKSITAKDDAWFADMVSYIKGLGKDNLIVQACSEWCDARNRSSSMDAKAQRWCTLVETELGNNGFKISWNKGSRPSTASSKYSRIDYHARTSTDLAGSDKRFLVTTDTSSILNEIQNGGVGGQTFKTDKMVKFATPVLKAGKSVALYGYLHSSIDEAAIKALGAIK